MIVSFKLHNTTVYLSLESHVFFFKMGEVSRKLDTMPAGSAPNITDVWKSQEAQVPDKHFGDSTRTDWKFYQKTVVGVHRVGSPFSGFGITGSRAFLRCRPQSPSHDGKSSTIVQILKEGSLDMTDITQFELIGDVIYIAKLSPKRWYHSHAGFTIHLGQITLEAYSFRSNSGSLELIVTNSLEIDKSQLAFLPRTYDPALAQQSLVTQFERIKGIVFSLTLVSQNHSCVMVHSFYRSKFALIGGSNTNLPGLYSLCDRNMLHSEDSGIFWLQPAQKGLAHPNTCQTWKMAKLYLRF